MLLEQFHDINLKHIKESFTKFGVMSTTMFAFSPYGKVVCCCQDFHNPTEKQSVFDMFAALILIHDSPMYTLTSEVWFSTQEPGPIRLPSNRSDRKEAILINTVDINGNQLNNMFEITRPDNTLFDVTPNGRCEKYINLFDRINTNVSTSRKNSLKKEFDQIEKPSWYFEIPIKS